MRETEIIPHTNCNDSISHFGESMITKVHSNIKVSVT